MYIWWGYGFDLRCDAALAEVDEMVQFTDVEFGCESRCIYGSFCITFRLLSVWLVDAPICFVCLFWFAIVVYTYPSDRNPATSVFYPVV